MKKVTFSILLAIASIVAFAQKGEFSIAPTVSFGTEVNSLGLGLKFQYGVTDRFRLEANSNYFFADHHSSMIDANVDAQYLFRLEKGFNLYPLVGITFQRWDGYDVNRVGLNFGGGGEYRLNSRIAFFGEVKGQFVEDLSQAVFSTGVRIFVK